MTHAVDDHDPRICVRIMLLLLLLLARLINRQDVVFRGFYSRLMISVVNGVCETVSHRVEVSVIYLLTTLYV